MFWSLLGALWWFLPVGLIGFGVGLVSFTGPKVAREVLKAVPWTLWAAAAVLVVVSGLYRVGIAHGAASRDGEIDELQQVILAERVANRTNQDAIEKLVAENEAWARAAQTRAEEVQRLIEAANADRTRLAAEVERLRRNRGTLYARDPDAAAWARQPVPAAIAEQLRRE